ncbi:hypothetical protein JOM56_005725 [Amanita muscaria]
MSILGSWLWGSSQLDEAIEKATSELLPAGSEEIALNLEICDQIRSKSVSSRDAMRALKRRLNHSNPNVQLLALNLTDTCVKNGGDIFLNEIASREFMDNLVSILKISNLHHEVKNTILRVIQNWGIAFEGKASLSYVGQVYKNLQQERYVFPPRDPSIANSAMVDTQTAPEWIDSDVCLRCRTAFTFTNRKHHCRNCGQVFDQQCSSKTMTLPHFGITQEVRVCDGCHSKLTKKALESARGYKPPGSKPRSRTAPDFPDEDLQRAIQMSLQEAGRPGYVSAEPSPSQWHYSEPPIIERPSYSSSADGENDADIKAAIEASLREANAPKPSAPTPRPEDQSYSYDYARSSSKTPTPTQPPLPKLPNYELDPLESDAILTFNQTVEQLQVQGGRDMSRYPGVSELYDKANGLRPKLALGLDDTGRKESILADMHEKLSQAVKLYDQILTEQLRHPRWRSGQPMNAYRVPVNGISGPLQPQWTGSTQVAPTNYVPASPSIPQPYSPATQAEHSTYRTTPQHLAYSPTSAAQTVASFFQPQLSETSPYHYSAPTPTPSQPPNVHPQFQIQPHSVPASMVSAIKSPTTEVHQYDTSATATPRLSPLSLTRSTTISLPYAHGPSAPSSPPVALSRNNTVSHPVGRPHHLPIQHHHRNQSVPQPMHIAPRQAPTAPAAPVLPYFPSAPTTLPQALPQYASSIPANVTHGGERKEALLIEL